MKQKLLVSFSGGETSAFMAQWLWKHCQDKYEMLFVFANTGQENEETLDFVKKCSNYFGFPVVAVEAVVNPEFRKGTKHKVVSIDECSRNGEPFESAIAKFGIPNQNMSICTRELKERPITSYTKSIWGKSKYLLAIGIRKDEADRMNSRAKEIGIIYPLIDTKLIPMTKPMINLFWSQQPFRLGLKGYQGNCKWCWKKSDKKLFTIAKENEAAFDFPAKMEQKYENFISENVKKRLIERGKELKLPRRFFRGDRSAYQIIEQSKTFVGSVNDDAIIFPVENHQLELDLVGGESCEVFSECKS